MIRPGIVYFTPSMNDPALLEAIFTAQARHSLAEHLMSRIRDSAESGSRHYSLVTGPRGTGKTHLVTILNHRVTGDAELHDKVRIAWLQEDPYAVSSYARLLRATLIQLDAAYGVSSWTSRLGEIQDLGDVSQIESALERVLVEFLGHRVLVLIAENFDDILKSLGDDGQKKLRAFLEAKGKATILATSTSLLPDLEDRTTPFYGTFKKYALEPFGVDDCVTVLLRIAEYREDVELAQLLASPQGKARVRAVHHIAGGNPRIYVIFYQFLSRESLDQLSEPFLHLVEELTPYYQARMQTLSPQQRTLIDIIRRHERPIAVRDIALAAFISSQSASSDLKILRDLGYVSATQVGRESLYELREPLMRICLAAKEQRGQSLPLFVEFLRIWYTPAELQGWGAQLGGRGGDYEMYLEAVEESRRLHDAQAMKERVEIEALERAGDEELAVARLIVWSERAPDDWWAWWRLRDLLEKLEDVDRLISEARKRTEWNPEDGWKWNDLNCAYGLAKDYEHALVAAEKALSIDPSNFLFRRNYLVCLNSLNRSAECGAAVQAALRIPADGANAVYWSMRGTCLSYQSQYREAAQAFMTSLKLDQKIFVIWLEFLEVVYDVGADRSWARITEFAGTLFPTNPRVWRLNAAIFFNRARYGEGLEALDKAISLSAGRLRGERLGYLLAMNDKNGVATAITCFDSWRSYAPWDNQYVWLAEGAMFLGDRAAARAALEECFRLLKARNAVADIRMPWTVIHRTTDRAAWMPYIKLWLEVFREGGELNALGSAMLRGVLRNPQVFSAAVARAWFDAWTEAAGEVPELALPLRLLETGVRFIETEDKSVLLSLPIEQRSLLEPEIDRYVVSSGKVRHEIDDEVDAFLETLRSKGATAQT